MECGQYFIEFDKTRFPLIRRSDWNWSISLFPVSKYQFERFLAENKPQGNLYTDKWYRELLQLNPRRAWKKCNENHWELFITGVSFDEIKPFLRYLGKDFRLPKANEWKALLEVSREIHGMKSELKRFCQANSAPPVNLWLEKGLFPLVEEGLLELVVSDNLVVSNNQVCCLGKPYQGLWPNTWKPEEEKIINWELGRKAVGFRVVKERILCGS